jgi:hypothetical protein
VRVSAWLKTTGVSGVDTPQYANVAGQAGLWIGVGSPSKGTRTDRMEKRAVTGTTDWQQLDFVVDVPADNRQMMVGFWMQGRGETWARDFTLEEVPTSVPVNFLVEDPQRETGPDLSLLPTVAPRPVDKFLPPPSKWLATGAGYELCDVGIDVQMLNAGQRNLSIACGVAQQPALRQSFDAAPFRGKRVRLSGWIKAQDVEPGTNGQSGMFLAMDNGSPNLRANVTGTTPWQQQELVIDVPRNASWLHIGISLGGRGQVWARDLRFEVLPGR